MRDFFKGWQRKVGIAFLGLACGVFATWMLSPGLREQRIPKKSDEVNEIEIPPGDSLETFTQNIEPLVAGIAKASSVILYEGMNRQLSESESIDRGILYKNPMILRGFAFYETPIPVINEDSATLIALCGTSQTFGRYAGPKFCGGFHPDWCVEFIAGQDVYQVLVCFGCREARLYGPTNEVFSDLKKETFNAFLDVLEPLHKELPMRQRSPRPESTP